MSGSRNAIARIEELHLAALEERVEADLALGHARELVGRAARSCRASPAAGAAPRPAHAGAVPVR